MLTRTLLLGGSWLINTGHTSVLSTCMTWLYAFRARIDTQIGPVRNAVSAHTSCLLAQSLVRRHALSLSLGMRQPQLVVGLREHGTREDSVKAKHLRVFTHCESEVQGSREKPRVTGKLIASMPIQRRGAASATQIGTWAILDGSCAQVSPDGQSLERKHTLPLPGSQPQLRCPLHMFPELITRQVRPAMQRDLGELSQSSKALPEEGSFLGGGTGARMERDRTAVAEAQKTATSSVCAQISFRGQTAEVLHEVPNRGMQRHVESPGLQDPSRRLRHRRGALQREEGVQVSKVSPVRSVPDRATGVVVLVSKEWMEGRKAHARAKTTGRKWK